MQNQKIINKLKKIKGLKFHILIPSQDKLIIQNLEDKKNIGVIECLKMPHTLIVSHDNSFRDPPSPIVLKKENSTMPILPPVLFPEIKNSISSSPSEKVHNFLIKKYNLKLNPQEATLLIGFK